MPPVTNIINLSQLLSTVPGTTASITVKMQWLSDALAYAKKHDLADIITDARAGLLYSRQQDILDNMIEITEAELTTSGKTVS